MAEGRKLYPHLALSALGKNMRIYLPYLLACTGTVLMFNLLLSLSLDDAIAQMRGGMQVQSVLTLGSVVVALFSAILLFYTNSVIIRNRKREFGLYNILGMEKRHIGIVLLWETLATALVTVVLGLLGSLVFSKLAQLLLMRMLRGEISLKLTFQPLALLITAAFFLGIFLLTLLKNLAVIARSRPIELLSSHSVGEREPKSRWLLALLGMLTLGAGYAIALMVKDSVSAILLFFVAVLLVIIGTYLLFTFFSIVLLKALRRSKRYYYKTNHFISVSAMLYRMKRNAAGLASICVLSTMVLVTISTTFSLYIGLEDVIAKRYPCEVAIELHHEGYDEGAREQTRESIRALAASHELSLTEEMCHVSLKFVASLDADGETAVFDLHSGNYSSLIDISVLTQADYERICGVELDIKPGEALYGGDEAIQLNRLKLGDITLDMRPCPSFALRQNLTMLSSAVHIYLIVRDSADFDAINALQRERYGKNASELVDEFSFNLKGDEDDIYDFEQALHDDIANARLKGLRRYCLRTYDYYVDYGAFYRALFFIGIFLGLLFVMSCVTIMYYKQVSEGIDDRGRYEIMQKVGLMRSEARSAIRSQILTVFFLPLLTAGVHIIFAFPMISYIMNALGLTDVALFARCSIGTFAAFSLLYTFVYLMTARAYYRIVEQRG